MLCCKATEIFNSNSLSVLSDCGYNANVLFSTLCFFLETVSSITSSTVNTWSKKKSVYLKPNLESHIKIIDVINFIETNSIKNNALALCIIKNSVSSARWIIHYIYKHFCYLWIFIDPSLKKLSVKVLRIWKRITFFWMCRKSHFYEAT